jgi:hypothetical protein
LRFTEVAAQIVQAFNLQFSPQMNFAERAADLAERPQEVGELVTSARENTISVLDSNSRQSHHG